LAELTRTACSTRDARMNLTPDVPLPGRTGSRGIGSAIAITAARHGANIAALAKARYLIRS
jgi:hypothetical protein